ncbi:MAG: ferritin-like domain-containing protein [Actinomycetota bacterium]|nr:ferritin-like domain-containing protein [Actinomycetota bacterium]
MEAEPMKVEEAIERLNEALPLQMRSSLQFTLLAGTSLGVEAQAVALQLQAYGAAELDDVRRLTEKIVTLGGRPSTDVAPLKRLDLDAAGLDTLIDDETEAAEALREVIPATGQRARSEALEHLLEHAILRKQNQIDFLIRARGKAEPDPGR